MSSSSRNGWFGPATAGALCIAWLWAHEACAAETYFVPTIEARGNYETNPDLSTSSANKDNQAVYEGDLEALMGARTQRSILELHPRVDYRKFPDRSDLDSTNMTLDLHADTRTQTTEWEMRGRFFRLDDFSAEFNLPGPDATNPQAPTPGQTGLILSSNTRTTVQLAPRVLHRLSSRVALGADASYESTRYGTDIPGLRTDYDFGLLRATLSRTLSPRLELTGGPYASRYKTRDDANKNDSIGLSAELNYKWSENKTNIFEVRGEHSDIERLLETGETLDSSQTSWGADFTALRKSQLNQLIFSAGRFLSPSGSSGKTMRDELRLQLTRTMSPRVDLWLGTRLSRERSQDKSNNASRDTARGEFSLRWHFTQAWFLRSGYELSWLKNRISGVEANNNAVFLSVGYQGLDTRRRH